jgi:hypothetical protein
LAGEIRERGSLGSWKANGRRAFCEGAYQSAKNGLALLLL